VSARVRERSFELKVCKTLGSASSGTTRLADPASIAARGMLSTTHVSILCAMVTPPRCLHGTHAIGAVVAHSRHEDCGAFGPEFFGYRVKQNVDRRPVAVNRCLVHEHHDVSLWKAPDF